MAEELTHDISGTELSAAFRLGFFSRNFDRDVLVETLGVLRGDINPSILFRLEQAVQSSDSSGGRSDSLAATADHALRSTACRPLYDLGAALGDYHRSQLESVSIPDTGPVWECVRHMPDWLGGVAACLHDLVEQANGDQDLEAVMLRANKPWAQMLGTDDDNEYRMNYSRILSASPPWVQRALRTHGSLSVLMFVNKLNHELAEASSVIDTGKGVLAEVTVKADLQGGDQIGGQSKAIVGNQSKQKRKVGAWAHDKPPDAQEYSGGHIEGQLQDLAKCVGVDRKTLKNMNKKGQIYIALIHGTKWELWFKTLPEYEKAWHRKEQIEKAAKRSREGTGRDGKGQEGRIGRKSRE